MKTATNPQTGEKLMLDEVSGQWVPMQTQTTPIQAPGSQPTSVQDIEAQIRAQQAQEFVTQPDRAEGFMGFGSPALESFLQGATMRFSDELGAGMKSIPDALASGQSYFDIYEANRNEIRNRLKAYQDENKKTAMGLEIGGSLIPAYIMARTGLGNMAATSPIKASTYAGGIAGGLSGAGEAENLGDVPLDTLLGTALGGTTGAATGFLFDRLVSPLASKAFNQFKTAGQKARDILGAQMRDIFPGEQAAQVAAKGIGPQGNMLDVAPGVADLGKLAASSSPRFKHKAVQALVDRSKDTGKRISESVRSALGTRGQSIKGTLETDVRSQAAKAGDLYKQAFPKRVPAGQIDDFISQIDDMAARFENTSASPVINKLKRSLFKTVNGEKVLKETVEELHFSRKDFADRIFKMRKDAPQMAGELRPLRDLFDNIMPDDYRAATAMWSGKKSFEDAIKLGRRVLKEDTDFFTDELARMSQADQKGVLIGASRAIDDLVKSVQEGAKTTGQLNKPLIAERLKPLFPDEESFSTFMDRVGFENTYNLTKNAILAGSRTQEWQSANQLLRKKVEHAGGADLKSGAIRRGVEWLMGTKNDKTLGISDDVADKLADDLLTQGQVTPEFIQKLMKTPLREKAEDFINAAIVPTSIVAGEQVAPKQ